MTKTDFLLALLSAVAIAFALYCLLFAPRTSDKPWEPQREHTGTEESVERQ